MMRTVNQKLQIKPISEDAVKSIPAAKLTNRCNPQTLGFNTTEELPGLNDAIGQPRAFRALELGIEVTGIGYNIFILGIPDSGRTTLTRDFLRRKAALCPAPDDWCYVNNFENAHQPMTLRLPAGRGMEIRKEIRQLIAECKQNIPRVFSSEEYTSERDRLVNAMKGKLEHELQQLEEYVNRFNFVIIKTPYGLFLGPQVGGKPLSPEEFEKLSDEQKEKLRLLQEKLSETMQKTLVQMREIEQTAAGEVHELDLRTSLFIIQPLIDALKEKYAQLPDVLTYLDRLQADLVRNASRFRPAEKPDHNPLEDREWSTRYDVNVLVNNAGLNGLPVVVENQPTYHNLLGSIEHDVILGTSYTDFSQVRAGALHRANGGYLILPARDVLLNPYAWEGLKRVLRDGELRLLELGSQMGLVSTASLDPQPIPLNIKVILVGTPMLYYMLRAYDEDFAKLFKVRAEFATEMERSPHSEADYALFVKSVVNENHLLHFDCGAVARLIEHGSRLVEDQEKLSTKFGIIADLICEASYWAKKDGLKVVNAAAVEKALEERNFRDNLIEERIQELMRQNVLLVDVDGAAVGQINALSVSYLGDYAFGRPNRVTASVSIGQAGVVDIERQARLGGPIHTKGVLIINGFLGAHYGQARPLNLTASLTFEQSYDEVEGDSASAAELIALLSAISGIPIDQSLAITGSINQHGQIQPIGGVNEKIEGFFETCRQKGLTGRQGVVIPQANCRGLMLNKAVCAAVEKGEFQVWPVHTIDDAVALLTGFPFGQRQKDGSYPAGSFNQAVVARLDAFTMAMENHTPWKRSRNTRPGKLSTLQGENED